METLFSSRFLTFDHESWTQPTSLRYAAELVRDGKVAAVLMDVAPEDTLATWWLDGSPTGETRPGFATVHASRTSCFTQLFVDEMGVERQTFSGWNRFMMAVKHAYPASVQAGILATSEVESPAASLHSARPGSMLRAYRHDEIDQSDVPMTDARMLAEGVDQLAAFLTIRPGTRAAGIRLWNQRSAPTDPQNPWSQPNNRGPHHAGRADGFEGAEPLTIRPDAGQLCLFNSANQHAWVTGAKAVAKAVAKAGAKSNTSNKADTPEPRTRWPGSRGPGSSRSPHPSAALSRLTILSFLVHHQDGWTLLQ